MKKSIPILITLITFLMVGCSKDEDTIGNTARRPSSPGTSQWLIPEDQVLDGGPGKDGIPAITEPKFATASATTYLDDHNLVIGYKFGEELRAYPHVILDWHEIVNDQIDNSAFAITYCPLTGTAINWNRTVNGVITTFGVSGLLYNSNLIPYDRNTDSNWSQMQLRCVNGQLIGTEAASFQVVETSWKAWKKMYPDSKVMTLETGFSRSYGRYPYVTSSGDYRFEDYLIFPVDNTDSRLDAKERVHGVISEEEVKVYRFASLENGVNIIEDFIGDQKIAIIGSRVDNYMVSFKVEDQELTAFESGEVVFKDQNENQYNIFGEIVAGPDTGGRLFPTTSFIGYWFSWAAFYPNVEIYDPQ